MKRNIVNILVEAWYFRTLECVDLDNGGKIIPPPTKKQWEASVKRDIKKHFKIKI